MAWQMLFMNFAGAIPELKTSARGKMVATDMKTIVNEVLSIYSNPPINMFYNFVFIQSGIYLEIGVTLLTSFRQFLWSASC